jgi:hypothetical protein
VKEKEKIHKTNENMEFVMKEIKEKTEKRK